MVKRQTENPNVIENTGTFEIRFEPGGDGNLKLAGCVTHLTIGPGESLWLGPDGWTKTRPTAPPRPGETRREEE